MVLGQFKTSQFIFGLSPFRSFGVKVDDFLQHLGGLPLPLHGRVKFCQTEASRIIVRMSLNKLLDHGLGFLTPPLIGKEAGQHHDLFLTVRLQADALAQSGLGFIPLPGRGVMTD